MNNSAKLRKEKAPDGLRQKRNRLLIASLSLNAVLITLIAGFYGLSWYIEKTNALLIAESAAYHMYFCEEKYDDMMRLIEQNDTDQIEQTKNAFALGTCLKNYKTGEPLDLSPLIDQVNETPPITNHAK